MKTDINLRGMCAPHRYLQGYHIMVQLPFHIGRMGFFHYAAVVGKNSTMEAIKGEIQMGMAGFEAQTKVKPSMEWIPYTGECSEAEVLRVMELIKASGCDVILGIGGGKVLDTAKSAAYRLNMPVIIVPTIASNDAPCSMVSVLYSEEHVFQKVEMQRVNPELVYVDTYYVTQAPARFLVAGMGDALATYFEAVACQNVFAVAMAGGYFTKTAAVIARTCFETLMESGVAAYEACKAKVSTPALEDVVEANVLMSGMGFESNGISIAHNCYNGFTALPVEEHKMLHGEYVAYGTLVELIMENAPKELFDKVMRFCIRVGLPVTFEDMGIELTDDRVNTIVEGAYNIDPGSLVEHEPFPIEKCKLADAIKLVDSLGKLYKAGSDIL